MEEDNLIRTHGSRPVIDIIVFRETSNVGMQDNKVGQGRDLELRSTGGAVKKRGDHARLYSGGKGRDVQVRTMFSHSLSECSTVPKYESSWKRRHWKLLRSGSPA